MRPKKDIFHSEEKIPMKGKIDYEEINKIIALIETKNLTHFELEVEGFKIKISRNPLPSQRQEMPSFSAPSSPGDKEFSAAIEPSLQESSNNLHFITSPMVGTFYRAPDPSSPPFVDIGDEVKKNQTLCIIEAMKLMNEIISDVNGVVKEIYVENGKPVEYGQKLFAIIPIS